MGAAGIATMLFYNQGLGLSASLCGVVFLISSVVDGISDPIVGACSDQFQESLGRADLNLRLQRGHRDGRRGGVWCVPVGGSVSKHGRVQQRSSQRGPLCASCRYWRSDYRRLSVCMYLRHAGSFHERTAWLGRRRRDASVAFRCVASLRASTGPAMGRYIYAFEISTEQLTIQRFVILPGILVASGRRSAGRRSRNAPASSPPAAARRAWRSAATAPTRMRPRVRRLLPTTRRERCTCRPGDRRRPPSSGPRGHC